MTGVQSPVGLGKGMKLPCWDIRAVNRTGATISAGSVVVLDMMGDTETPVDVDLANLFDGTDADPSANVITITVAQDLNGQLGIGCIADEDVADDETGRFWIRHPDIVVAVETDVAAGEALILPVTAIQTLDHEPGVVALNVGDYSKIVGFAHETEPGAAGVGFVRAMFDGFYGFGLAQNPGT